MSNIDLLQSIMNKNSATLQSIQKSAPSTEIIDSAQTVGKAMAFQMVSQATGMLVEDAASFLRNVIEINLAVISVATYNLVESGGTDLIWVFVIEEAFSVIEQATAIFTSISAAAGTALNNFPA